MNNICVVIPAKAGVQVSKNSLKSRFKAWITAFAGMTVLITNDLWAMAPRPTDPNAPQPPAWVQWFPMIVMVAVFYLLLIRPQMKQRKERDNMMNSLKKGDRIVTQGGLVATIVNVTPDFLEVKLNEETKVKLRRSGVAEVLVDEPKTVEPVVVK